MSGKLFTNALSDETLAKLTDDMLNHENINKNKSKIKFNHYLFRIIPAVAAIVLVIGLINILPVFMGGEADIGNPGASVETGDDGADLKLGLYVSGEFPGIEYSSISLRDNNEFSFSLSPASSYIFMGTYDIEDGKLILHDNSGMEFTFEIKNGQLIYQSNNVIYVAVDIEEYWVKEGTVFTLQENDNAPEQNKSIDFNISLQPQQYNENPFSNTPYDGSVITTIIKSVEELESMLSDEYFGVTETDGTGQESTYIRSLSDIYDDEYFKGHALVAVAFEYASMSIPKNIYKVEIDDRNHLIAWAYQFEDMTLPENEKFTSGLYTTRVFLIEVNKFDVEGVDEVYIGIDGAPVVIEKDEQEYYTYEEYIEYIENDKALLLSLIDCIDENWMPVGNPVLTQKMYDKLMENWEINKEKTLEEIKSGVTKVPKLPQNSYPYAVYDTMEPRLDLKCRIENGKWVLYNNEDIIDIMETFNTKDEMLERARRWLSRGVVAGEIDMAQANTVYRRLYFTVNGENYNATESLDSEIEEYSYYPVFDRIEKIYVGDGYEPEKDTVFMLSDENRSELWQLMRIDEWVIASDLPLEVAGTIFRINENEKETQFGIVPTQSWAFKQYNGQLLIVPSLPDENSVKVCYFAPFDILTDIIAFTEKVDVNPDSYGWIKVNGTTIDYPVVQSTDNEYYLTHDFEKKERPSGSIFADYRNDRDVSKNYNTVIYGHNMLDGSMFCPLIQFGTDEELFQNCTIELHTEEAVYKYEVFAAYEVNLGDTVIWNDFPDSCYRTQFADSNDYLEYLNDVKSRSIFQKDRIVFTSEARTITLSTWVNDTSSVKRMLVHGVLVEVRFS